MIKKIIFSLALFALLLAPGIAQAQSLINTSDGKYASGSYELNDFMVLAAKGSTLILTLLGSVVLLMFVYGGVLMMTSGGGDGEKIKKGKQVIQAALVGMLIVFASFMIIKFVFTSFGIEWNGSIAELKANSVQQEPAPTPE